MASYTKTYSGDLGSAIAGQLYKASNTASEAKRQAQMFAAQQGDELHPFDPKLRPGEFFSRALQMQMTAGLPRRFQRQMPRYDKNDFTYFARGQSRPFASPIDKPKPTSAVIQAKLAGQPFANVAAGADLKHQKPLTFGKNASPQAAPLQEAVKKRVTNTTEKQEAVKVKDEKLGNFLAALALSLQTSLAEITRKVGDTEEVVIAAKDSLAGTHKMLEETGDTVEHKLDAIIAALREQNAIKKEEISDAKVAAKVEDLEQQVEGDLPNSFVGLNENAGDVRQQNEMEEVNDRKNVNPSDSMLPDPWEPDIQAKSGYHGMTTSNVPDSGVPINLLAHKNERIDITPIDNAKHKDGKDLQVSQNARPPIQNINNWMPQPKLEIASSDLSSVGPIYEERQEKYSDSPEVKEAVEKLQHSLSLVPETMGIFMMNFMGRAASSMGPVPEYAAAQVSAVTKNLASVFGVPNAVTGSLEQGINTETDRENRKIEAGEQGERKKEKNWFQKLLSFVSFGGGGGGKIGTRRGTGGGTKTAGYGGGTRGYGGSNSITNSRNSISNWWNSGRTAKEGAMGWRDLIKNDWSQRQYTKGVGKGIWNPLRGMPGYGTVKQMLTGQANPGGFQSGPTPLGRQVVERPLNAIRSMGAAKGGFVGLMLNELMNPASLADGTLDGHLNSTSNGINASDINMRKSLRLESESRFNEEDELISSSSESQEVPSSVNLNSVQTQSQKVNVSALETRARASHDRYYQKAYVVT